MKQNFQQIRSPLTKGPAKIIAEFKTLDIVKAYKTYFNLDVSDEFVGLENLFLFQCIDSGYQFFYPFDVVGEDKLYKHLATFDWYYIPWKWEHEQSLKYAAKSNSILEIGCGSGFFLKSLQQRFPEKDLTGLEITVNETSEKFIVNQTIQDYVTMGDKIYDLVCSFQVLEHIPDVGSFLEASVKVLKPGGHLIISVPNNDSIFFKNEDEVILNMPPHHMGRWNKRSLSYLASQFPIELVNEYYEPIQDYHFEWFKNILKQRIRKTKLPMSFRLTSNQRAMNLIGIFLRKFQKGHTSMFVYKKNDLV